LTIYGSLPTMHGTALRCVGLTTLGALALAACSSEQVGNGAGGSAGSVTGGASLGGTSGAPGGGNGGGAGGSPSCTGKTEKAELPAIDLFVALDASDSMYFSASGGSTRWDQVASALLSFFRDPASAGVGVDLGFFPVALEGIPDSCTSDEVCGEGAPCWSKICLNALLELDLFAPCESNANCEYGTGTPPTCRTIGDCSTAPDSYCFTESVESCEGGTCTQSGICSRFVSCRTEAYEEPAVALSVLPDAQRTLVSAVQGKTRGEETTTAPALSAAIERARTWAADHPDHDVSVVLATGGLPTACFEDSATKEEAAAELAAIAGDGAKDGVRTHVIGVLSELEIGDGAGALLDSVAEAGETEEAVVIDAATNVSTAFGGALAQIRGLQRGCEFLAPDVDDDDHVNVVLRSDTGSSIIPRVRDADACDGVRGGWHYDVDPAGDAPKRISLCATSCVDLRIAQGASVEIELGCASQALE
jgi:hypothetical protein